jgi:hypothetical protein
LDSTLRTKIVYEVADSFESTKSKISQLLLEHHSGKMEEDGTFSYQANFMLGPPSIFNIGRGRIVYSKGYLEVDGENTLIHFTICPSHKIVFFLLLIFPSLFIIAIMDNRYLMPGGKGNVWKIIEIFLSVEGILFAVVLSSTYLLKLNFERRFDLSS